MIPRLAEVEHFLRQPGRCAGLFFCMARVPARPHKRNLTNVENR
jgi:hypothetical protein